MAATLGGNPKDDPDFQSYWNGSKYMQVVFSRSADERIAYDAWAAAKQLFQQKDNNAQDPQPNPSDRTGQ